MLNQAYPMPNLRFTSRFSSFVPSVRKGLWSFVFFHIFLLFLIPPLFFFPSKLNSNLLPSLSFVMHHFSLGSNYLGTKTFFQDAALLEHMTSVVKDHLGIAV